MKLNLKKSLYVGLAAASVLAASGFAATTASAKSYAYVTKPAYFTTAPESRNVVPTGENALYSKPGTIKGARVIASKTTMGKLTITPKSTDYFRAYAIVSTNRGSVYYKVVSFDGHYRGWIYGGKDTTQFGGGIKATQTTRTRSLPSQTTGYTIVDPSKNTLWTAPKNTQYKATKITGFKSTDTFTIIGAETKIREGSLYYQVRDDQNPSVTGWIYYAAVRAPQGNLVKITYIDGETGAVVGKGTIPFDNSAATTNLTTNPNLKTIIDGIPSGYVPYDAGNGGVDSLRDSHMATAAKNGSQYYFSVTNKGIDNLQDIQVVPVDENNKPIEMNETDQEDLHASSFAFAHHVKAGDTITSQDVQTMLEEGGSNYLDFTDKSGTRYHFVSAPNTVTTTSDARGTVTIRATFRAEN